MKLATPTCSDLYYSPKVTTSGNTYTRLDGQVGEQLRAISNQARADK